MNFSQLVDDKGPRLQRQVTARVGNALALQGWRTYDEGDDRRQWRLERRRGDIHQRLDFGVFVMNSMWVVKTTGADDDPVRDFTDAPRANINPWIGFSSDRIGDALCKLLPEDAMLLQRRRSQGGVGNLDFFCGLGDLFPRMPALLGEAVQGLEDVTAWVDEFCRWYAERGADALDGCRDIFSLNRLLHTPWSLRQARSWSTQQMLATLVVVHMCDDPAAPFMDWLGVVRRRQHEKHGWRQEFYASRPGEYHAPAEDIAEHALVERLIERLRKRRRPNA